MLLFLCEHAIGFFMYLLVVYIFISLIGRLYGDTVNILQDPEERTFVIPRKIWQTYKDKQLPRPAAEARTSWIQMNPNYEYNFMDDAEIEDYILNNWDKDTYQFFKVLPIGVMKADLWRYLIIADKGGIYSDIDTLCCLPIDYWLIFLASLNKIKVGKPLLFLGIENDDEREVIDFCQWTFMATPKHPAMEFACRYIVDNWRKNDIDLTPKCFVHLTTGPTILKYALMTYLDEPLSMRASDLYRKYQSNKECRRKINDRGIYLLPKLFYNGLVSLHLVGSMNFREGYIRWSDEAKAYRIKQISDH
jgi:mannosyltransferase OCH1-like enzyme